MKKFICVILCLIMLFSSAVMVNAQQTMLDFEFTYMPTVDGKSHSMIYNKYYQLYYNDIFEHEYTNLHKYSIEGMTEYVLSMISEDVYTYATVILNEKTDGTDYHEYNKNVLETAIATDDIIYIGDTTPLSVIKITKDTADKLMETDEVAGIFFAFFSSNTMASPLMGEDTMGNVAGNSSVTAEDARLILRYAAGLEEIDRNEAKQFYFCGDMDFDGEITSSDARLALRTAAGLEKTVSIDFGHYKHWNDFSTDL